MAGNVNPIFPKLPRMSWGTLTAANTAKDGTGTVVTLFTAGADGSVIDRIMVRPKGTNVATVLRLFVNNGLTNATAANNVLVHEVTLPASTVSEVAALTGQDVRIPADDGAYAVPIPHLPAGYKINATIGTAVAAGYDVAVFGGDF